MKTLEQRKREASTRLRAIGTRLMLLATQVETEAQDQLSLDRLARAGDGQAQLLEAAVHAMTDVP